MQVSLGAADWLQLHFQNGSKNYLKEKPRLCPKFRSIPKHSMFTDTVEITSGVEPAVNEPAHSFTALNRSQLRSLDIPSTTINRQQNF